MSASARPSLRVVVFIDYQNLLNDGRRAFCDWPFGPADGQIDPMRFARLLASRRPPGSGRRVLQEVRVYRGRPDPRKEAKTYAPHMRQCTAWAQAGATVVPRPLRYPRSWPAERAEEKGIDVQIAIDMVTQAINRELDVAILATTDTDLRPALEAFFRLPLENPPVAEVAVYKSQSFSKKLHVPGKQVWTHFIEEKEYRTVRDNTDYNAT